jgi:hypothetical protein
MPRIRNLKEQHLCHPPCELRYIHIDPMFSQVGSYLNKLTLLIAHVLGTALLVVYVHRLV